MYEHQKIIPDSAEPLATLRLLKMVVRAQHMIVRMSQPEAQGSSNRQPAKHNNKRCETASQKHAHVSRNRREGDDTGR